MLVKIKAATERDVPQIVNLVREFAAFAEMREFCTVTEERLNAALFGEHACIEGLIAFDEQNRAVG